MTCGSGIKISNQQGTLTDGRVVAVKKLSVASHQGKSQFVAEIATISAVQHRNLVKLYGCCIEGDKRLLVYEYLENNNLEQALFGKTNLFLDCGYLAPEYAMRGHLTEKLMSLGLVWLLLKLLEEGDNPLNQDEIAKGYCSMIDLSSSQENDLQVICSDSSRKQFKFDHVFKPEDNQGRK
ncbi:hypothetical protein POM88_028989 [Heracleum sosnowskyi]|uniref:Protein kinase domain-containing protein n=1 Tax=Heracleum sosnowskyi TaxID=360622 RepID=A0AAD8MGU1_9APIA|nr:hypothetical protein POM88_028989 [Heracleum sosnowskyi]